MPYVMNRYVVPLVVMSVLVAALFVGLAYILLFPYPQTQRELNTAKRDYKDLAAKNRELVANNEDLLALVGGEADQLRKAHQGLIVPPGASTAAVWQKYFQQSAVITQLPPDIEKRFPAEDTATYATLWNLKADNLDQYVTNLEKYAAYLKKAVDVTNFALGKAGEERTAVAGNIRTTFDAAGQATQALGMPAPQGADDAAKLAAITGVINAMTNEINSNRAKITQLTTDNATLQARNSSLDASYKQELDRVTVERDSFKKDLDVANSKLSGLQVKVEQQAAEIVRLNEIINKRNEPVVEKGTLGNSYTTEPSATVFMVEGFGMNTVGAIDIGANQHVRPGMVFQVMHNGVTKAGVQITKVDENASYFKVLSISDERNPIVKGDDVFSPFHHKGKFIPTEFVLVGDFPEPLTRDKIIDRIKEMGGAVADKVTTTTKYVIIGLGQISQDDRQNMELYNTQRITLATLKDFFGQ